MKADALFSYQPPFNVVAFVVLKPASWILSPRALHSLNVFLIKLTNFPILIAIGLYERFWTAGQSLRETSKGAAQSIFNSLPRHIKNMPLVEALVGSTSQDLFEAIFEVETEHQSELFADGSDDDEFLPLRSYASRENLSTSARRAGSPTPARPRIQKRPSSLKPSSQRGSSPLGSPRLRAHSLIDPVTSAEIPSLGTQSPLARLFMRRSPGLPDRDAVAAASHVEASVKKIDALFDDLRDLPVQGLKDEIKELQVNFFG